MGFKPITLRVRDLEHGGLWVRIPSGTQLYSVSSYGRFFLLKGLTFLIYPKLSDVFILLSWVTETTTTRKQIKHNYTLQQMCFVLTIKSAEGFFSWSYLSNDNSFALHSETSHFHFLHVISKGMIRLNPTLLPHPERSNSSQH